MKYTCKHVHEAFTIENGHKIASLNFVTKKCDQCNDVQKLWICVNC